MTSGYGPAVAALDALDAPAHSPTDTLGTGRTESTTTSYERSPRDLLRLVVGLAATIVLGALTRWAEAAAPAFESDTDLVTGLPSDLMQVLAAVVGVVSVLAVVGVLLVPIVTRRVRLLGYLALAVVVSEALFAGLVWWLDRSAPAVIADAPGAETDVGGGWVFDVPLLVPLAAAFTVLGPFVGQPWRKVGLGAIALLAVARASVSVGLPTDVVVAVLVGMTVGSAVLLALGRPSRRPTDAAIAAALADSALGVSELHRAKVDARGSTPYFATMTDGTGLFVKVLGDDERAADLLFRIYRFVRLKNVGDERPFSDLRRTVEHEALLALTARDVGIRTPRFRGVVDVGADSMLLAYEQLDGRSLDSLEADEVTDGLMRETWELVAQMQDNRIAHRDLRCANVFVDAGGQPWMIDFGFSELAASDALLHADTAQLLASFAVITGSERAVAVALAVLGRDRLAAALPRLQIWALSGATQTDLKAQAGLLERLQTEAAERCGVDEVAYEQLTRLSGSRLVAWLRGAGDRLRPSRRSARTAA